MNRASSLECSRRRWKARNGSYQPTTRSNDDHPRPPHRPSSHIEQRKWRFYYTLHRRRTFNQPQTEDQKGSQIMFE